jgi:hypothetical protein
MARRGSLGMTASPIALEAAGGDTEPLVILYVHAERDTDFRPWLLRRRRPEPEAA